jgi:hypothetical protein
MQLDKFGLYLKEILENEKVSQLVEPSQDPISRAMEIGYVKALQSIFEDYKDDLIQRTNFNLN